MQQFVGESLSERPKVASFHCKYEGIKYDDVKSGHAFDGTNVISIYAYTTPNKANYISQAKSYAMTSKSVKVG